MSRFRSELAFFAPWPFLMLAFNIKWQYFIRYWALFFGRNRLSVLSFRIFALVGFISFIWKLISLLLTYRISVRGVGLSAIYGILILGLILLLDRVSLFLNRAGDDVKDP